MSSQSGLQDGGGRLVSPRKEEKKIDAELSLHLGDLSEGLNLREYNNLRSFLLSFSAPLQTKERGDGIPRRLGGQRLNALGLSERTLALRR